MSFLNTCPCRLLLVCLVLAGCTTLPDAPSIVQPEVPEAFTVNQVLESTNTQLASDELAGQWWEGFQDPLLNQLIVRGLADNPSIAQAMGRLKESQALLKLAGAGDALLVNLGADLAGQRREGANSSNSTNTRNALLGLDFSLPLDVSGRVSQQVEAAAAAVRVAQASLRSELLLISANIAREYLIYRGNQRQLQMLRDSVSLQEKTLNIVQVRFDNGLSPELDVRRAETSVENLRANISPLLQALQNGRNRLSTLTAQFPSQAGAQLDEPGTLPSYTRAIPQTLPLAVVQARPDAQESLASLIQAIAEVGVARADFYPTLALSGSLQVGALSGGSGALGNVLIAALGAMLNQTLIDGGERDARFEAAYARAEVALAAHEQTVRQVIEDVENRLSGIQNSQNRQNALAKAVASSQRSFSQADTLYQLGLVSFLDVVDAQRVLANAEQALAAEQTNYATLIVGLFQALGVDSGRCKTEPEAQGC